ncbi:MAG: hypothetical protein JKX76_00960 [Colwellia sp.]|nr:hypothetical protein [Colwellia sp.]
MTPELESSILKEGSQPSVHERCSALTEPARQQVDQSSGSSFAGMGTDTPGQSRDHIITFIQGPQQELPKIHVDNRFSLGYMRELKTRENFSILKGYARSDIVDSNGDLLHDKNLPGTNSCVCNTTKTKFHYGCCKQRCVCINEFNQMAQSTRSFFYFFGLISGIIGTLLWNKFF